MSRTGMLVLLGVLIILTPFSGLPVQLRTLLSVVLGASVAGIGLLIRAQEAKLHKRSGETEASFPTSQPEPEPLPPPGMSPV